jgi:hypothetical protein
MQIMLLSAGALAWGSAALMALVRLPDTHACKTAVTGFTMATCVPDRGGRVDVGAEFTERARDAEDWKAAGRGQGGRGRSRDAGLLRGRAHSSHGHAANHPREELHVRNEAHHENNLNKRMRWG